ncbi:hypothetical protein Cgig2_019767 [Carnegiea gigantea]|uniref:UDP-N-acetylglucosamine--dolichyl-phosphate N-acetylglucosaminephosphotransferase n=1 Tax=Carnegiea gigantea TaxID=171969 RepID=A0A9Q1H0G4_9CARY|nr:hypothetical protein Cgig2_019767 [Carnegiea gigantea]
MESEIGLALFTALPLLMAYTGHTTTVIPKPLIRYVGLEVLDLEVRQMVVIASAILIHNVMQIGASKDPEYQQAHTFSIYLVQPFLATSLALPCDNWYPSSVFVEDTYTYFVGMTMAVVGILDYLDEYGKNCSALFFFLSRLLHVISVSYCDDFLLVGTNKATVYSEGLLV